METFRRLIEAIEAEGAAALITLAETAGSSPREAGVRMVVRASGGFYGTIGGGELEHQALEEARAALAAGRGPARRRSVALGPELGQCCGGRVVWRVETFDARDLAELAPLGAAEREGPFVALARLGADGRVERRLGDAADNGDWRETFGEATTPVYLFGAGHVGRALALALAPLPFAVRWIDPRPDEFPKLAPANVTLVAAADPPAELTAAPDGAFVLAITHSHALDLAVVAEALRQDRFAYVGVIGSATKRARFASQLRAAGFAEARVARLVCPIGAPGIAGKEPAVIAVAVAAQLLMARGAGS
jgi:xanthine dehydrogenase accessory factor